jgi:hypothetical protein
MRIPQLRRHKHSRRGFVRVKGMRPETEYFEGEWPAHCKQAPAAIQRQYQVWVKKWLKAQEAAQDAAAEATGQNGTAKRRVALKCPLVVELWELYHAHCQKHYRKDGRVTSEAGCIALAWRIVVRLYSGLPADQFGALELLAVREEMIQKGWVRNSINIMVSRVRAGFKWAAKAEQGRLIPMAVYRELQEVEALQEGRCDAPEGEGQGPVDMALVEQTLPHCSPTVRVMVRAHYHMGCRSQDLVMMRPCDIDRNADHSGKGFWLYTSPVKKTKHRDKKGTRQTREAQRLVYWIKPALQELLLPLIVKAGGWDSDRWVFSTGGIRGVRSDSRGRYTTSSYRLHIVRACDRLFPAPAPLGRRLIQAPRPLKSRRETDRQRLERLTPAQREQLRAWQAGHSWNPYQLRHRRATDFAAAALRAGKGGTEISQRMLQHEKLDTTAIYAERNRAEMHWIMEMFG